MNYWLQVKIQWTLAPDVQILNVGSKNSKWNLKVMVLNFLNPSLDIVDRLFCIRFWFKLFMGLEIFTQNPSPWLVHMVCVWLLMYNSLWWESISTYISAADSAVLGSSVKGEKILIISNDSWILHYPYFFLKTGYLTYYWTLKNFWNIYLLLGGRAAQHDYIFWYINIFQDI